MVRGRRYVPGHLSEHLVPLAQHGTEGGLGITYHPLRLLSVGDCNQIRRLPVGPRTACVVPVVNRQPGTEIADVVDGVVAERTLRAGRPDLCLSSLAVTATLHLALGRGQTNNQPPRVAGRLATEEARARLTD